MSTNFFVVQAQRDLRDAQNTELRALADYRKSLVTFERAQEAPAGGGGGGTNTAVGGAGTTGTAGAAQAERAVRAVRADNKPCRQDTKKPHA